VAKAAPMHEGRKRLPAGTRRVRARQNKTLRGRATRDGRRDLRAWALPRPLRSPLPKCSPPRRACPSHLANVPPSARCVRRVAG